MTVTVKKLEEKLKHYEAELNDLMNNTAMRDMCFTACGCGNRSTQKKLILYRNKIGDYGEKIKAINLALKIANKEPFTHQDIMDLYNDFLGIRNPELYYEICEEVLTFKTIKKVVTLIINLFLPICKKQVLKTGLIFSNRCDSTCVIPLI